MNVLKWLMLTTIPVFAAPCDPEPEDCNLTSSQTAADKACNESGGMCPDGEERDCLAFGQMDSISCQTMCLNCDCVGTGGIPGGPGSDMPQ